MRNASGKLKRVFLLFVLSSPASCEAMEMLLGLGQGQILDLYRREASCLEQLQIRDDNIWILFSKITSITWRSSTFFSAALDVLSMREEDPSTISLKALMQ